MTQVTSSPFTVSISSSQYAGYTDGQGLTTPIMTGTQYSFPPVNEPYRVMLQYSGICLDSANGKLYFFGGGHNDGFDNSIYELPMDAPVKTSWVRHMGTATNDLYRPVQIYGYSSPEQIAYIAEMDSDCDKTRYAGGLYSKQRPIPRHTAYSNIWIPSVGKMLTSGSSYADEYMWYDNLGHYGSGWGDQWLYNPSVTLASRWEHIGHPTGNATGTTGIVYNRSTWTMARAGIVDYAGYSRAPMYVPALQEVVAVNGSLAVMHFNPISKTWATYANSTFALPFTITKAVTCYDPNRHSIFLLGGNHGISNYNDPAPVSVFEYPLATAGTSNNWVYRSTTGSIPAVDTVNGDNCLFSTWSNSPIMFSRIDHKLWRLNVSNASTWSWSVVSSNAFPDASQSFAWAWCPVRNVGFHLVNGGAVTQSTNLYVFRA